jgi:hypothetical protein
MLKNKGGRPRASDEGVDEATLKKRQKARDYAAKKRAELKILKEKSTICDKKMEKCDEHMKNLKEDKKELEEIITEIQQDLKPSRVKNQIVAKASARVKNQIVAKGETKPAFYKDPVYDMAVPFPKTPYGVVRREDVVNPRPSKERALRKAKVYKRKVLYNPDTYKYKPENTFKLEKPTGRVTSKYAKYGQ